MNSGRITFAGLAVDGNELLERFNRGLAELRDNGRIEQYLCESRQGEYIKAE